MLYFLMPTSPKAPSVRLFIGGLPYKITEGELLTLFASYGRIISLKIMHTPWGKSRGMGFIEFDNLQSAIDAKVALHNYKIDVDRTIIVDYAEPDPMTTDEGRQRHLDAAARKEQKYSRFHKNNLPNTPENSGKKATPPPFKRKPQYGSTRQSTYDSRNHHSRVGAKFAKRKAR